MKRKVLSNDITFIQVERRGSGMTMASLQWLLKELQANPKIKTVFVNFELPQAQREIIEKYAVIKLVGDIAQNEHNGQ